MEDYLKELTLLLPVSRTVKKVTQAKQTISAFIRGRIEEPSTLTLSFSGDGTYSTAYKITKHQRRKAYQQLKDNEINQLVNPLLHSLSSTSMTIGHSTICDKRFKKRSRKREGIMPIK